MHFPPSVKINLVVLSLVAAMAVLTGCLVRSEQIAKFDRVTTVALLSNKALRTADPLSQLNDLTLQDYEIALRRIVVTYSSWFGLVISDPTPLLTDGQVRAFTTILQQRLPELKADQRLQFRFKEPTQQLDVLAEVYAEGDYLVFDFLALARDLDGPIPSGLEEPDRATIVLQSGQQVKTLYDQVILREPIRRESVDIGRIRQHNLDQISAAQGDDVIKEEEAERLRQIVRTEERLSVERFAAFMETRRTLEKAFRQNLFNEQEYASRKAKLIYDLDR